MTLHICDASLGLLLSAECRSVPLALCAGGGVDKVHRVSADRLPYAWNKVQGIPDARSWQAYRAPSGKHL